MRKIKLSGIIALAVVIAFTLMSCPNDPPGGGILGTPTNIVATTGSSTSIIISWPTVFGALQYYVYSSSSAYGTYTRVGITTPSATGVCSYTATGLLPGTTYYFKISAYNSDGESSQSSYVSGTTLIGAPTNISATASTTSITVSWSAASGAAGYYVYSSSSAYGTYTQVGTTSSTSYTVIGLSRLTTYYFKVSSYNSTGESSPSSYTYATTALDAPANISATAVSSTSITVSWSEVSGTSYYYVYYSTDASDTYTRGWTTSSTSYTVTGLSQNTTYYFKVSAYNSNTGESSQSSYTSATTVVLDAPATVVADGYSPLIRLIWSGVFGATGYYIYQSSSASGTYTRTQMVTASSSTLANGYHIWWTANGLSPGTYYFRVSAYNSYGESSLSSYASATIK